MSRDVETPRAAPDRSRPPAPGRESRAPMPAFELLSTSSGIPVYLAPRAGVPLIELELQLDAGGERNPANQPGLSAMTASVVDEGTRQRTGPLLSADLERRGGSLSCHADWNAARLGLRLLASDLDFGLALLAELVHEPVFPPHEFDRLRQQTLAELRRRSDQPAAMADEAFAHHLFAGTNFSHPLAGTPDSLAAMTREALVEFHQGHYRPQRGAMTAAGDFAREEILAAIEAHFPARSPANATPRSEPRSANSALARDLTPGDPTLAAASPRVIIVDRPGAEQTEIRIGHLGVPRRHPDRVGLGILNTLLGGKFTSRINLNLRERHGFTYGASSRFIDRKSRGPFVVSAAVTTEAAGRATQEVLGELRRIREEPVQPAELEETRSYLLGVFPYGLQTIEGLSARLGEIALYDLPLDTPARYLAEVAAIRAEEISRLAQAHLRPEEALVVAVGPATDLERQLRPIAEPQLWRTGGAR